MVGDDDPSNPSGPPGGPGDEPVDPAACVGDGGPGSVCVVTGDCEAPFVCADGVCVGPHNPDVACDPIEGKLCAGADEVCVANVCVLLPGACVTVDECPLGFLCADGQCVPDNDGTACADPGPGPDLGGTWAVTSHLYMRDGLPGVVAGLLDVSELLADFVEGDIDLGLPAPVEFLIGALVSSIIDAYVPPWAQDLILVLGGFADVLDTMTVEQTVTLAGLPCDANYRGSSTWDTITFEYKDEIITARPEDIPEIGPITPEDFGARYSCGQLYIDRHRVQNSLTWLVRWLLDTLVEATTGYPTVEEAIDAAIDCDGIAAGINSAWQSACGCSTDITAGIAATCTGFKADLMTQITMLIDEAAVNLSVVSLAGIADVQDASHLDPGVWYGAVIGFDFPGDFTGTRQ